MSVDVWISFLTHGTGLGVFEIFTWAGLFQPIGAKIGRVFGMAQYLNGPWINLTSLLFGFIGAIGVVLAIFFYYKGIRVPIPAYINAWRTRIVDKSTSATPGLQVLHDGIPIAGKDVTSATVYVWNAGRASIRKVDVLRPYAFCLGEDGTLLHANILKATRQECGISISFSEPLSNRIALNFDVLEYGDGAAVQLIFAGLSETPISMAGVCVGAETIKDATQEYRANHFNYENPIGAAFLAAIVFFFSSSILAAGVVQKINFGNSRPSGISGLRAIWPGRIGSHQSWFVQ